MQAEPLRRERVLIVARFDGRTIGAPLKSANGQRRPCWTKYAHLEALDRPSFAVASPSPADASRCSAHPIVHSSNIRSAVFSNLIYKSSGIRSVMRQFLGLLSTCTVVLCHMSVRMVILICVRYILYALCHKLNFLKHQRRSPIMIAIRSELRLVRFSVKLSL